MRTRWKRRLMIMGGILAASVFSVVALLQTHAGAGWVAAKKAQLKFNWVYRQDGELFSREPSDFLLECVDGVPPGRALDVAMGQGRNTLALARKGWEVTGFDVSDVGLEIARAQALQSNLEIHTVQTTCEAFDYGKERWDLVVLTYTPMPFHDAELIARLKNSLRIGGFAVIETFLEWSPDSGTPRVDGLTGPGELRRIFSDFEITQDREFEGTSEWFPRRTRLLQFCARKPKPGAR